jgi:hypothetical protein
MTRALSRPQIDALRYASGRQLYADDINNGNGNMRRTLLSLLKIGMLAWDPIYQGRVVLTTAGKQKLADWRQQQRPRAARRQPVDPPSTLRIKEVGDYQVITLAGVHKENS